MKKVIFLTYDFPYPFNSGGKIRAFNLLKYAHAGFDIRLFSFTRGEIAGRYLKKLSDIGVSDIRLFPRTHNNVPIKIRSLMSSEHSIFHALYFSKSLEDLLYSTIVDENIDIMHAESFYTGYYINDRIKSTGVKTVFGTENIEHKIYQDYVKTSVKPLLKKIYIREVDKIRREEEYMVSRADLSIAVSTDEQEYFRKITHNCEVVENGIDCEYFTYYSKETTDDINLLFVGNFKYFPNIDAVKFLYDKIYKKLSSSYRLTIVGKNAEKLPLPRDRNIKLIEYIDDIRDVYRNADVFLFPVQFGGGTNFKVLEAMATGVPIIGHPDRLSALHAQTGKHFLAAQSGEEYLSQLENVLQHPSKVATLTKNARSFIEKNYGWKTIGSKLNKAWKLL